MNDTLITLNCKVCDVEMSSIFYDESDVVICSDCWGF